MGEYAHVNDSEDTYKIGTCKTMYYLRFEDRKKTDYTYGWEGCSFRIPFPDEDKVQIGIYDVYNRGERLNGFFPDGLEHGKSTVLELVRVKLVKGKLYPLFECPACGKVWRCDDWEILDYIPESELKNRLLKYSEWGE